MRCRRIPLIRLFVVLVLALAIAVSPITSSQNPVVEKKGTPPGWTDDINLSNNVTQDQYCEIDTDNEYIHAIWLRDTVNIMYSKSVNKGISWTTPINIYQSNFLALYPDISVSSQDVHMVVSDYEGWNGIYYRNSTDNGNTWNNVKRISSDGVDTGGPGIYVNDSNVHIIWHDKRDGGNGEVYYRRSLDSGITFDNGQGVDEDRRVTFSPAPIGGIKMAGEGSNISVVWGDERDGDWEIYWMISEDNGFTWEDGLGNPNVGRKISDNTVDSTEPKIAVNGSQIHIVWVDEIWPGPVYKIYYRNSTDYGNTWNPVQLLVDSNYCHAPDIVANNSVVHLVWHDWRDDGSTTEIYYMNSTDGGTTWGSETRLTFNEGNYSDEPKTRVDGDFKHIIWTERRDGNREIYYKRYPDFPPDPVFNISIQEGWNLISFPLDISGHPLDMLDDSPGVGDNLTDWDVVMAYDTLNNNWLSYSKNRPGFLNTLTYLDNKMGFWINITNIGDGFLTFTGLESSDASIVLYTGWNLVGYPTLNDTETVANALWGTGADKVMVFDTSEPYHIKEVGPTYVMKPGEGYWVRVVADSVWFVDW